MSSTATKSKTSTKTNPRLRKAVSDEIGARIAKMEIEERGEPAAPASAWEAAATNGEAHAEPLVKVQAATPAEAGEELPPLMSTEQARQIALAAITAKDDPAASVLTKAEAKKIAAGAKKLYAKEAAEAKARSKPAKAPKGPPPAKAPKNAPAVKQPASGKAKKHPLEIKLNQEYRKLASAAKNVQELQAKRMSCLDAAAMLMAGRAGSWTAKGLITAMAAARPGYPNGLWVSPSCKNPAGALFRSMTKEIEAKGSASRFKKVDKGLFRAM